MLDIGIRKRKTDRPVDIASSGVSVNKLFSVLCGYLVSS